MRHHGGPALTDTGGPASIGSANGPEASLKNYESKLKSKLELGFNVDRSGQPRAPAEAGYN